MAEILDSFDFAGKVGRPVAHPYDEWLDGKIRRLVYGKDFHTTVNGMRGNLSREAKKRNILVRVAKDGDDVVVQAYDL